MKMIILHNSVKNIIRAPNPHCNNVILRTAHIKASKGEGDTQHLPRTLASTWVLLQRHKDEYP